MRLPPGESSRKLACPSQVRVPFAMPAAYRRRNVRPVSEPHHVVRRWAAPGIAAAALLASLGGLGGVSSLLLLAAIVAGAVRLIDVVGLAAEGRGERLAVVTAATGLTWLVAAGVTHVALLVVGLFA